MSVPGPVLGPCESWISGVDVADCCGPSGDDDSPSVFEDVALDASMILYEVSGRQFAGLCTRTVRPCQTGGSCWDAYGPGGGWAGGWAWSAFGGWGWWDDRGQSRACGCTPLDKIKLGGYPIREILEVKIDGQVVDPATYDLVRWRFLVRTVASWPACQNEFAADTEAGTFSVAYRHGIAPPDSGRDAAAALACELYKACASEKCAVPKSATKTTRQGVTVERKLAVNWLNRGKPTGILEIDSFLAAYNPGQLTRRPAVMSPDVPSYPQPD